MVVPASVVASPAPMLGNETVLLGDSLSSLHRRVWSQISCKSNPLLSIIFSKFFYQAQRFRDTVFNTPFNLTLISKAEIKVFATRCDFLQTSLEARLMFKARILHHHNIGNDTSNFRNQEELDLKHATSSLSMPSTFFFKTGIWKWTKASATIEAVQHMQNKVSWFDQTVNFENLKWA